MFNLRNRVTWFLSELVSIHSRATDLVECNARLDNENTALRRELAATKEERNALGRDLYALSRGEEAETMAGKAVELRISLIELRGVIAEAGEANPPLPPPPVLRTPGVYDTGKDKWTYGERDANGRRHLGPCRHCGARTVDHGNAWRCTDERCFDGALQTGIGPSWWTSNIAIVTQDGVWAAFRMNEPASKVGHATTPGRAIVRLLDLEKEPDPMPLADLS